MLEWFGFLVDCFDFEIIELFFIDDLIDLKGMMECLKVIGCCFLLDDFGIGYVFFGYILKYLFLKLKVDWIFVKDVVENK